MKNPFFNENKPKLEKYKKEINVLSWFDNPILKFIYSFYLYFKYKLVFSNNFCNYEIYRLLYENETVIFDDFLKPFMNNSILDIGCGVCQFWINNQDNIKRKTHCVDLDKNIIKYPQYILKNDFVIIDDSNIYNIDLKQFNIVFMIEVVMQLDNPEKILSYIWSKNPDCKIILAHTCFSKNVALFYTPIKKYLFPYLPLINIIRGDAMTLETTNLLVKNANGKIITTKHIKNNRYVFVLEKSS